MSKVDVSSHHNAEGKLYMPSYPWGVHYHKDGVEPTNGGPLASLGAKTKTEAMRKAEQWCLSEVGRSSVVFRRSDGEVVARYQS